MIALASGHTQAAQGLVDKINTIILFPLMSFMLTLALLYFLLGAYEFVQGADSDDSRSTGKTHMMFGIIGMLVMVSAMAILKIAAGTFGIQVP
jgi:hypothetical protein